MATDSLHRTIRGLVATALRTALTTAGYAFPSDGVREMDTPDTAVLSKPGIAISEGIPSLTGGGTNVRDVWLLPIFIGHYSISGDKLTGSPVGIEPGRFLEIVRETFHNRRLSGASNNVLLGEMQVMGPPYDDSEPSFVGLTTAAVITYTAYVTRGA